MMTAAAARESGHNFAFGVQRLETFLSRTIAGFRGPVTVRQLSARSVNPSALITTPSERFILRSKPPVGEPSAPLDREFRILAALHAKGFPTPRPLIFSDDLSIIGTPFYVMAFVEGRVFEKPALPATAPVERTALYEAMVDTLARLHAYDPSALGLSFLGKNDHYLARQVEHWSQMWLASGGAIAEMDKLMAWLPEHLPPEQPLRLIHGDYRIDKLIISPNEAKIAAVIDWEQATLGDPIADAVRHFMIWVTPPAGDGIETLVSLPLGQLGIPAMDRYLATYASRVGIAEVPHLNTYLAFNFFRMVAAGGLTARQSGALAKVGWAFAQRA
jgi:aminoglycoside phosphotransferase (APT) family kinase protein